MIKRFHKKGFSLVELLVVITIIAILSVVAYTALGGQTLKARNSRRAQDLGTIQSALEIYFIENANTYPTSLDDLDTIAPELDLVPKYMPKMPKDPTTLNNYKYVYDAPSKTYQLSATLETEATPFMKAYLIGNSTTDITAGVKPDGNPCVGAAGPPPSDALVKDGSITCIPYKL